MMRTYTWINDNVKIDFPITDVVLRNTIDDCEKYDLSGDYQYFGMASAIDVLCKAFVTAGHMKKREWELLTARYPEC